MTTRDTDPGAEGDRCVPAFTGSVVAPRPKVRCVAVMSIKHFAIEYDEVNEQGTFSPGDVLSGRVTVVTSKATKTQCLLVKAKGKAKVSWFDRDGQTTVTHRDKKDYFCFEHILLQDKNKGDGLCLFMLFITFICERMMSATFITTVFFSPTRF